MPRKKSEEWNEKQRANEIFCQSSSHHFSILVFKQPLRLLCHDNLDYRNAIFGCVLNFCWPVTNLDDTLQSTSQRAFLCIRLCYSYGLVYERILPSQQENQKDEKKAHAQQFIHLLDNSLTSIYAFHKSARKTNIFVLHIHLQTWIDWISLKESDINFSCYFKIRLEGFFLKGKIEFISVQTWITNHMYK